MSRIKGYHAHIYFDTEQFEAAKAFAQAAREQFGVSVGRFHQGPIGPHPRGSCQLSMKPETFAQFAIWAPEGRGELTIFGHGLSGCDKDDHTRFVVWFGPSEPLDLSIFE